MHKDLKVVSVLGLTEETDFLQRDMRNAFESVSYGEEVVLECGDLRRRAVVLKVDGSMVVFRVESD